MKEHHKIWLAHHPDRTKAWLMQALKQGMDVHHLDGDHKNNNPENLVLIEHTDHFRLHSNWKVKEPGAQKSDSPRLKGNGRWLSGEELEQI